MKDAAIDKKLGLVKISEDKWLYKDKKTGQNNEIDSHKRGEAIKAKKAMNFCALADLGLAVVMNILFHITGIKDHLDFEIVFGVTGYILFNIVMILSAFAMWQLSKILSRKILTS